MQYNILGKTGLTVSQLCMGTMTFGTEASAEESQRMFDLCRDGGINFFDCANKYGDGRAERILGECVASCRDEVILTTKAASNIGPGVNDGGASRKHLMLELEKSLKRLKTDYIDIYFIHYFDPRTSIESILRFLDDAIRQGKILFSGVSNWAAWQIMKALHISRHLRLAELDCIQPMYSLVKRQAEVEILPLAEDQQLGVMIYSPIGAGLLTGKYAGAGPGQAARLVEKDYYNKRYSSEQYYHVADHFVELARDYGHDPAPLAIRWTVAHPGVTSAIIGARNCSQLQKNMGATAIEMDEQMHRQITAVSPPLAPAHDRLEEVIDSQYMDGGTLKQ